VPLANDIADLRDRILADLDAAHDYYFSTATVWRLTQQHIRAGETVSVLNEVTGTTITHETLAANAQLYLTEHLTVSTLQQFVSLFEDFLLGLIRAWLLTHHKAIDKKQVPIATLFEATDLADARARAIGLQLNELSYKKLRDWFEFLKSLVHLDCPTEDEIQRLAEIKATRDIFIHNRGVVNAIYVEKAGDKARFRVGETAEVPEPYHRESWELIKKVVADLSDAAVAKA
jgi:hypothetical protein